MYACPAGATAADGEADLRHCLHFGFVCDGCKQHPIRGPRYKSVAREDYDLCGRCMSKRSAPVGEFEKIDQPNDARHGILCVHNCKCTCTCTRVLQPWSEPTLLGANTSWGPTLLRDLCLGPQHASLCTHICRIGMNMYEQL